jgi:putative ABC transport system permease protein
MKSLRLILRWSWRDLRAHWAKVVSIALVIAIGTGGYAAMTSNANWRRTSYETNYELLDMYDVRIQLTTGSFAPEGTLAEAAAAIDHTSWIEAVEERLIVPTQVDASLDGETILVRGEITGSSFADGGPHVNGYHVFAGRPLTSADAGNPTVMLDQNFARFYELPAAGRLTISGGRNLDYVATATTPEYFMVAPEGDIFMSEADYAGLFTTLETVQDLAGTPGAVNEAVLTVTESADVDVIVGELEGALATLDFGTEVTTRADNRAYETLTTDVENDQQMYNALAFLLFTGAVVATFILVHRLAQHQRREFGVSMALGVSPARIALRPLLVSAQIALLGVVLGVGVGALLGGAFKALLEGLVPLPMWQTPFQTGLFAGVAVVGFLLPFLATAIPIWRAVRVAPVDAIKPAHLSARQVTGRRRGHSHMSTFSLMPFRNLRRAPWRSGFTMLAIAFVITGLVAFLGILDSFTIALDDAFEETAGDMPDRVVVGLDSFYPVASPAVQEIFDAETVAVADPTLRVGGTLSSPADSFDALIEFIDLEDGMWTPTLEEGEILPEPGVVLAEKAAGDLGVGVGDVVTLRHPARTGPLSFDFIDSQLPVQGIHPYPMRNFVYLDTADVGILGLNGITNVIQVEPGAGFDLGDVKRELFAVDAVASVQSATGATETVRNLIDQFMVIIQLMAFVVLAMAMLIAFLTASISLDARVREHATMFAFGVKVRTAMRMAMTESLVIGIVGTVLGLAGGIAAVWWMTTALLSGTMPDFGMNVALEPTTIIVTVLLGIGVVVVAPLFTARRLRRMDLPGTLRLVE